MLNVGLGKLRPNADGAGAANSTYSGFQRPSEFNGFGPLTVVLLFAAYFAYTACITSSVS